MTTVIMRGDRVVGQFSVDPYEYRYDGNDDTVAEVLKQGPPEEIVAGAEPPPDVEVDADGTILADQRTTPSPDHRRRILSGSLRSLGLRLVEP